ncbi:PEP/pyruvate-binding domain-containing protein [Chloroflexota bacterium]
MRIDVFAFNQLPENDFPAAGGKGGALALLSQAEFPVPEGFVILPSAFDGDDLKPGAWSQINEQVAELILTSSGMASFAVRSSALAEDSARASFAGEFETVLDVWSESALQEAIRQVRSSHREARVQVYSQAQGLHDSHDMAVVVQRMVQSDISGVLFTVDPVTGDRGFMSGNFVHGLGDKLVSGEVDAHSFKFQLPKGKYQGPPELKRHAGKIFKLARRLEQTLGCPQDIEWAIADGNLYLLQSRPITTLVAHNPATGEWNDTLTGDFLWTNTNFGEAVTEPMTPLAWSVLQFTLDDWVFVPGFSTTGNIGGMPYINISLFATIFKALGKNRQDFLNAIEGTLFMQLPDEMEIPHLSLRFKEVLQSVRNLMRVQNKQKQGIKQLPDYLAKNPAWFDSTLEKIQQEKTKQELRRLWDDEIKTHIKSGVWTVLGTASHSSDYTIKLRRDLTKLVGPDDANLLIANILDDTALLPNLGPVVGLAKVASGEMDRGDYLRQFGHRGPHEFEISVPRPVEDPAWIDQQLAQISQSPIDIDALLEKQQNAFEAAWARLVSQHPAKSKAIHRRIAESARRARLREFARSEYVRDRWLVRLFACRAGELLGLGDDVFYLSLEELLDALSGDEAVFKFIAARRETHQRYKSLPTLPPIIKGHFGPFQWANDPQKRTDIFDAGLSIPVADASSDTITGCPGSAGQIEGVVRLIHNPDEGQLLQKGEILVTVQTDISWTVLFPRAGGIITDVGAPLSHAAIIARELGIPAVVGCGDATMRLETGDRVRVLGGSGVVEIIERGGK